MKNIMTVKYSGMPGKRILRVLLTVAFVASLGFGLEGCKKLRFTKSSSSEQTNAESAETTAKAETTNSTQKAAGEGDIVVLQAFDLCTDCLLTNVRGQAIHRAPDTVQGALEGVTVFGDKAQFKGWAADTSAGGEIQAVLIFADDKLVHMGPLTEERYDVAQTLGDDAGVHSGFSVVLPKSLFDRGDGKGDAAVRLFALTPSGTAAELPFKKPN